MLWPVWLDHKTNWWWWKLRVSLESGFGKLLKNLWVLWLEHNKETLGCEIWTLTNNSRLICSCNRTESSTITEEIQTNWRNSDESEFIRSLYKKPLRLQTNHPLEISKYFILRSWHYIPCLGLAALEPTPHIPSWASNNYILNLFGLIEQITH